MTAACLAALAALAGGCAAHEAQPAGPRHSPAAEPRTAAALLRIAAVFNDDYDNGVLGTVWDRWDARSQAIISRADYIRRREQCPPPRVKAQVESASPAQAGAWLVRYEIDGVQRSVS